MFAENPEAYAPRYGGWCAWAAAENYAAATVAEAWNIVDGDLYRNANLEVERALGTGYRRLYNGR